MDPHYGTMDPHRAAPTNGGLPELEGAVLPVKGEEVDVDGTGRAEDGGREPVDGPRRLYQHVAVVGHLELGVVTGGRETGDYGLVVEYTHTVILIRILCLKGR